MYVPIMKNRDEEIRVIRDMNGYFNDSLIPLIEIFRDKFETTYKTDTQTGEYIYEQKPGSKRRNKVKLPPTEDDIVTLEKISESLNGKTAFIDFFRFDEDEYEKKTFKNIELSFRLSRDFEYYRSRVLNIGDFNQLIPVISIKDGLVISNYDLIQLIVNLRRKNPSIALRITDNLFENYIDTLEEYLNKEDFVMLDIREKNADSKFIEIEELQFLETEAKKILLNSPRPRTLKNGDFENLDYTSRIDNKVAQIFTEYNLNGFGDFGGLKDTLPEDSGGNGTGAALGLIYLKEKNAFFSVVNEDTSIGVRGYEYVRDEILSRGSILDSNNSCLAMKRISEMEGPFGNWGTWNNITLTRYIQQQTLR